MISIIITNFFLAAFAITNFACFDATQARSPGSFCLQIIQCYRNISYLVKIL